VFSPQELQVLFSRPLPGNLHWLTWLGLYTGARLNELCQLTKAHVKNANGVHYLHFSKDLQLKTGETRSGVRSVPIHPDVIAAGFLEFVSTSSGMLFSNLTKDGKTGRYSRKPSRQFGDHLKRLHL
jgi:integrase